MLPAEFLARMERQLGEAYPDFLGAYDRPRAVGLRFNPLKTDKFPTLPFLTERVPWEKRGWYYDPAARPGLHPYHEAGLYYLQEPSAMAPVTLLDPRPGEVILDLCAAPGGKTTQIAAAMAGQGLLICNEINAKRAKVLSRNVERMGVTNALVLNQSPQDLAERFPRFFDKILVDAPCSGEGMFRKEEAAVTDWSPETVAMCARRQREILGSAAKMLAPGGRLVYSTCTFAPQEDEGAVSEFLHTHPDFQVEAVKAPWFAPGDPKLVGDPAPGLEKTFRLMPHLLRGEGHYAAVLRHTGSGAPERCAGPGQRLPKEAAEFCEDTGVALPEGKCIAFGTSLFLAPAELPELRGLKVLRPGLELGDLQKGRFQPAHALALASRRAARQIDLDPAGPEIAQYLQGQVLPGGGRGWTLVTVGGYSIGWAKASDGRLKNHYPKGLRRP